GMIYRYRRNNQAGSGIKEGNQFDCTLYVVHYAAPREAQTTPSRFQLCLASASRRTNQEILNQNVVTLKMFWASLCQARNQPRLVHQHPHPILDQYYPLKARSTFLITPLVEEDQARYIIPGTQPRFREKKVRRRTRIINNPYCSATSNLIKGRSLAHVSSNQAVVRRASFFILFNMNLYLFGDQTLDIQAQLKTLLRERNNPLLEVFLADAYEALRYETYNLPWEVRQRLPRLSSVEDLASWNDGPQRSIALDMSMTCIFHLATFISQVPGGSVSGDETCLFGICTGALAAAAVSCSADLPELIRLGVAAVRAAFRLGKQVADVGQRVAPCDNNSPDMTWSIAVSGPSSEAAVREFCEQHSSLPPTSRPYITAHSPSGIFVGGPPGVLAQLTNSPVFQGLRWRAVPVYGPYHAPHLYSQLDVAAVVEGLDAGTGALERVPLLNKTDAAPDEPRPFGAVLESAVAEILLRPIHWPAVIETLQQSLSLLRPASFTVVPIATTADQLVYKELQKTPLRSLPRQPQRLQQRLGGSTKKPKLAIIGMSGRFPDAQDTEAFWDLLSQGLDVHKTVPPKRWDIRTHVDPTGQAKNTCRTPYGCWLEEPGLFDARFFNISPREALQIDPAQRLALLTAYEALEQAGIVPDTTPSTRRDRAGVFYGITSDDWRETNAAQNIDTYHIPGGNRAFLPGRVNYFFKFSGPSYAIDTACSSSLAAIYLACSELWNGKVDMAVAGGTNILTNPDLFVGLDRGHFLSTTGNCKTFDDGADGYCRGEGIATVVLKRLDDALADGDPILATILGSSTNHSSESESITRPNDDAQRALFKTVLNQAGVDPYSVSYVEMHGTGTQAGDATEMSSVLATFAPADAPRARTPDEALYLGSVKANIGHGEAAAGVSSLAKVLLMLQRNTIVPHCGIKTRINHKFPTGLAARNVHIAAEPTPWGSSGSPRRALINNFSAAGGNTCLLLESPPPTRPASTADPRGVHVVALSAKNGASLQGNLRGLRRVLDARPDMSLGQLSYTTTARRMHFRHRLMLAATSIQHVKSQIDAALRSLETVSTTTMTPKSAPRLLFTYTGQGAQYPGMGRQLLEQLSVFRREIYLLDRMAQALGFPSFLPFITSHDGEDMAAFSPTTIHLAALCMQMAMTKLWASWNVKPAAVVGHSLGQYAALNAAGVLSDADAIYLVGRRAQLIESRCTPDTHAMLVVRASTDEVAGALDGYGGNYETACINSPVETVLAGTNDQVADLASALGRAGFKTTMLRVRHAFHSSQMEPVVDEFKAAAAGVTYHEPRVAVLCPLDGTVAADGSFGPDYVARHLRQPVKMEQALVAARSSGLVDRTTLALELGPHPAVGGMVRAVLGQATATTLPTLRRGSSSWETLTTALKALYCAGADVHWRAYHGDFAASHVVVPLNAYSWDLNEYWIPYVNDWALRKGDPPMVLQPSSAGLLDNLTTIHRLVDESGTAAGGQMVVEADVARGDVSPLVRGHEVDGVPLCTPSFFCEMALSIGRYLAQRYRLAGADADAVIDVCDLTISKALIADAAATEQLLRAHISWTDAEAAVRFTSVDGKNQPQEHACCAIRFPGDGLRKRLQANLASNKAKTQELRQGLGSGNTTRFNRTLFYRVLQPLARFDEDYRAIDEVILDSDTLQVSSRVNFATMKKGGSFSTHPAAIDALTMASSFSLNCNDGNDFNDKVFVNHGWGSFQVYKPLDLDKVYETYTEMKECDDGLWRGDIAISHGEEIVAAIGQFTAILTAVLAMEGGGGGGSKHRVQKQRQHEKPAAAVAPLHNAPQVTADGRAGGLSRALEIIADESGLRAEELEDNVCFCDIGVDSLLALDISSRLANELGVDMDFNMLLFECPTVGDLKHVFSRDFDCFNTCHSYDSEAQTCAAETESSSSSPELGAPAHDVDFQRVLGIIAEESGLKMGDLNDDTNFADAGIDSLLSLVIINRFRTELDLDLSSEALFLECSTVAEMKTLMVAQVSMTEVSMTVGDKLQLKRDAPLLAAHNEAVDGFVSRYVAHLFSGPSVVVPPPPPPSAALLMTTPKVVLIMGYITWANVVCVERIGRGDERQDRAMRRRDMCLPPRRCL
ncbi:hypothetical protein L249_0133, partial [Ophiocordyceps polyrhachis-furcata BCC 54312]